MKILLLAALIELDDDGDDTENESSPVPAPAPYSPDKLLQRLLREVRQGRKADIWKEEPHGSFFQI